MLGQDDRRIPRPGLLQRLPAIVIVTPEHRAMIAKELSKRHVKVDQLERDRDLQMLDADEILTRFMVGPSRIPSDFMRPSTS